MEYFDIMIRLKRRLFCRICFAFVILYASPCSLQEDNSIPVVGIDRKSVGLKCNLNVSDPPDVQWEDTVYNSDANPCLIFNSTNNFTINPSHPNRNNYEINREDFTLTINLLKLDDDPGEYFCHSRVNNVTYTQSYYLTVGELPKCSGNIHLTEGEQANLACASNYSGTKQPKLSWFRGNSLISSENAFEIRLAQQRIQWNATYKDDKQTFTCQMIFGDMVEECKLYLDVKFLVRDITMEPSGKDKYQVDDKIDCTAKGNPAPKVSFEPSTSPGKFMDYSKSIIVQKSWEGREVMLTCSATNTLGSREELISKNFTIQVAEPTRTTKIRESLDKALDNTPVVIGTIIVVALVLLVIIIAVVLVRKHQEKQRQRAAKQKAAREREQENGRKGGKVPV